MTFSIAEFKVTTLSGDVLVEDMGMFFTHPTVKMDLLNPIDGNLYTEMDTILRSKDLQTALSTEQLSAENEIGKKIKFLSIPRTLFPSFSAKNNYNGTVTLLSDDGIDDIATLHICPEIVACSAEICSAVNEGCPALITENPDGSWTILGTDGVSSVIAFPQLPNCIGVSACNNIPVDVENFNIECISISACNTLPVNVLNGCLTTSACNRLSVIDVCCLCDDVSGNGSEIINFNQVTLLDPDTKQLEIVYFNNDFSDNYQPINLSACNDIGEEIKWKSGRQVLNSGFWTPNACTRSYNIRVDVIADTNNPPTFTDSFGTTTSLLLGESITFSNDELIDPTNIRVDVQTGDTVVINYIAC